MSELMKLPNPTERKMEMPLDKTAGTTGTQAEMWVAFTDAALALLRSGEDGFALVAQLVDAVEAYWDEAETQTTPAAAKATL